MEQYIAIILTSVTALAAILAPLFTALINNKNARELKKYDTEYLEKYNTVKAFFSAYGSFRAQATYANFTTFLASASATMLITSEKTRGELRALVSACKEPVNLSIVDTQFDKCVNLICFELYKERTPK